MKARKCTSGQFIVITALMIGIIALSTAIFLYETQVYQQHFRYRPYQDVTIDLENDVRRALACSLANATISYNKTWGPSGSWSPSGFDTGEGNAKLFLQKWRLTVINAFAGQGVNLVINNVSKKLVNMTWASPNSVSSANATLTVNMTTLGMFSWQRNVTVDLRVAVNMTSFKSNGANTNFTFRATEDTQYIVNDLPNTSVRLSFYNSSTSTWKNASVLFCDYMGNGVYSIEFTKTYVSGLRMMMWVQDRRNILVAAGFTLP